MNEEYYSRVATVIDPRAIQSKRVVIVGQGSGGSMMTEELGRLGARLLLVDRPGETLGVHNLVRHLLGADSLGKEKHTAMTEHLLRMNPALQVESAGFDVVRQLDAFRERVRQFEPDLMLCATDAEDAKFAVDMLGHELSIPAVGGGVYDGGVGGEVYATAPGSACYGCIFEKLQGHSRTLYAAPSADYTSPHRPEHPATVALRLDIFLIASLCVRKALQCLLSPGVDAFGVEASANVVVFANRPVPGVFAKSLTAQFHRVAGSLECLHCGTAHG